MKMKMNLYAILGSTWVIERMKRSLRSEEINPEERGFYMKILKSDRLTQNPVSKIHKEQNTTTVKVINQAAAKVAKHSASAPERQLAATVVNKIKAPKTIKLEKHQQQKNSSL